MTTAPLGDAAALLRAAGIDFMVVGSYASTYHAEPRTTRDVDLVVELDEQGLTRLLDHVDFERYYVPVRSAREAVSGRGQFNLIDLVTGWKLDLIVRRDRPFSREEFARRQRVVMDGVELFVATAEDTILSKLEWAQLGGSDRQMEDAVAVLRVLGASADDAYLDRWAAELGVSELLCRARSEAGR